MPTFPYLFRISDAREDEFLKFSTMPIWNVERWNGIVERWNGGMIGWRPRTVNSYLLRMRFPLRKQSCIGTEEGTIIHFKNKTILQYNNNDIQKYMLLVW